MKQEELIWHHTNKKNKIKNIAAHIEKIEIKNQYDALTNDELTDYGSYKTPWKLDSAATGNYCGEREKVRDKKKKPKGIKVVIASGGIMNQTSEGKAPIKNLPKEAEDVQIFPKMSNPLLCAGTDVPQSFTTTKACVTPMGGTSPMVTPAPLADSQIKIMNLMQPPMIQKERADCTNVYLTRHEDVGRGIV